MVSLYMRGTKKIIVQILIRRLAGYPQLKSFNTIDSSQTTKLTIISS